MKYHHRKKKTLMVQVRKYYYFFNDWVLIIIWIGKKELYNKQKTQQLLKPTEVKAHLKRLSMYENTDPKEKSQ